MILVMKTTEQEAIEFLKDDKLCSIDELSFIDDYAREIIKQSLNDLTGIEYGFVPCLSKVNGKTPGLLNSDIFTFLETYDKNYLFKVDVEDSICLSIGIEDLLSFTDSVENVGQGGIKVYSKRLCRLFNKSIESGNVLTFIPYVTFNNIKDVKLLNENWEAVEVNSPILKECEDRCMQVF